MNEAYDNVGKLNKISVINLGFSDFAEVVGRHLILNANYFNSKLLAEDGIKEFIKRNILPSKADLKFIAAHEWVHCATQEFLDNHPRSKLHLLYQRNFGKYLTGNSAFDVYEFTADALAAWLRKIPCKYAKTVVNLLKKEGALEYVSDK